MHFPVSGVDIFPGVPFAVAFVIAFFSSMGGISGAFLLLPFQVSVLGFTSPSVSSTNLVYNVFSTPSGIYRYFREGRMLWPLAGIIILGSLPGVFIGAVLRIAYLPDPGNFKLFIGCVLFYAGVKLLYDVFKKTSASMHYSGIETTIVSLRKCVYEFNEETVSFNPLIIFVFTFFIGIIGGTYGIGGGSIIAPFLISVFGLPVYTIAGATLLGTFFTSVSGVIFYCIIAPIYSYTGLAIAPDWMLGAVFGAGGFCGTYLGARMQKYIPASIIKIILILAVFFISSKYIIDYFI